jgi:hypothetical protein
MLHESDIGFLILKFSVKGNNSYSNSNIFRNMLGLAEAKWENKEVEKREVGPTQDKQRTLSDFLDRASEN